MRVAVTGGAGFQGSHLVEALLARGDEVTVLNTLSKHSQANVGLFKGAANVVWGSITDRQVVSKTLREHDLVFHLAANIHVDESIADPRSYYETNVLGTANVVETCVKDHTPLIHVSSCEVYGYSAEPCTEDTPLRPRSPYAASKAGAECLARAHAITYGSPVLILRPTNVFGTRQRGGVRGAVIPRFASLASRGLPLTLYGDGSQRRDFIGIATLAEAYLFLADSFVADADTPPVINIGTASNCTIAHLAERANAFFNNPSPIATLPPRAGEVQSFTVSNGLLRNYGFEVTSSLDDELIEYFRSWRLCS